MINIEQKWTSRPLAFIKPNGQPLVVVVVGHKSGELLLEPWSLLCISVHVQQQIWRSTVSVYFGLLEPIGLVPDHSTLLNYQTSCWTSSNKANYTFETAFYEWLEEGGGSLGSNEPPPPPVTHVVWDLIAVSIVWALFDEVLQLIW